MRSIFLLPLLLLAVALATKYLIPYDLPWLVPGGWPLGSHWYRINDAGFVVFLAGAIVTAIFSVLRLRSGRRS